MGASDSALYISVIAPVLNRETELNQFHSKIQAVMEASEVTWKIIYIDDGSTDRSWQIIQQISSDSSHVAAIRLSRNFGQHAAIAAGLQDVNNSAVILIDVDNDSRFDAIPRLIETIRQGIDLAVACENLRATFGNWPKTIASRLVHRGLVVAGIGPKPNKTFQPTSLRALSSRLVFAVREYGEYGIIFGPLTLSVGFTVKFIELSQNLNSMPASPSGYSIFDRITLSLRIWLRYSRNPPKSPFILGALVIIGTVVFATVASLSFLFAGGNLLSAAAWFAILQLVGLGAILILLALQLTIAMEIFREVLDRPRFHIQEKINSTRAE